MFGTPSSTPFGTSAFGTPSSTPAFGTPSSSPAFGTPSSTPAFGTPSTPAFGTPSSTPAFGTPSSTPAFGTPSTPSFATPSAFGSSPSPFFQQSQQQQQQQPSFSLFPQQQQSQQNPSFGFQQPSSSLFGNAQITTQMAPVAPISISLPDRDLKAIMDAYNEEPRNQKYCFRHLFMSVTDPAARVKPVGASDIMWVEAVGKLEGMETSHREMLWPQLLQGFKDLSNRVKIQDEVIVSDAERLRIVQANVKMLERHFQGETRPWLGRLKHKVQGLRRRLLRVMIIMESLEVKGLRLPLMKSEVEMAEKLDAMARQLQGPGAELSRRVHNLLSASRVNGNFFGVASIHLPESVKIDEQSVYELQEAVREQTEATARVGNVLKRDIRNLGIIMSEGTDMVEDDGGRKL